MPRLLLHELHCHNQEDSGRSDELILRVRADGAVVGTYESQMSEGDCWRLNLVIKYRSLVSVELYERDAPGTDDSLGRMYIEAGDRRPGGYFNGDHFSYELRRIQLGPMASRIWAYSIDSVVWGRRKLEWGVFLEGIKRWRHIHFGDTFRGSSLVQIGEDGPSVHLQDRRANVYLCRNTCFFEPLDDSDSQHGSLAGNWARRNGTGGFGLIQDADIDAQITVPIDDEDEDEDPFAGWDEWHDGDRDGLPPLPGEFSPDYPDSEAGDEEREQDAKDLRNRANDAEEEEIGRGASEDAESRGGTAEQRNEHAELVKNVALEKRKARKKIQQTIEKLFAVAPSDRRFQPNGNTTKCNIFVEMFMHEITGEHLPELYANGGARLAEDQFNSLSDDAAFGPDGPFTSHIPILRPTFYPSFMSRFDTYGNWWSIERFYDQADWDAADSGKKRLRLLLDTGWELARAGMIVVVAHKQDDGPDHVAIVNPTADMVTNGGSVLGGNKFPVPVFAQAGKEKYTNANVAFNYVFSKAQIREFIRDDYWVDSPHPFPNATGHLRSIGYLRREENLRFFVYNKELPDIHHEQPTFE